MKNSDANARGGCLRAPEHLQIGLGKPRGGSPPAGSGAQPPARRTSPTAVRHRWTAVTLDLPFSFIVNLHEPLPLSPGGRLAWSGHFRRFETQAAFLFRPSGQTAAG